MSGIICHRFHLAVGSVWSWSSSSLSGGQKKVTPNCKTNPSKHHHSAAKNEKMRRKIDDDRHLSKVRGQFSRFVRAGFGMRGEKRDWSRFCFSSSEEVKSVKDVVAMRCTRFFTFQPCSRFWQIDDIVGENAIRAAQPLSWLRKGRIETGIKIGTRISGVNRVDSSF